MSDSFTEITERGLFSRLGNAIKGLVIGLLLFVASFPLLFWNEGRAVRRHQDLEAGARAVVAASAERVDPAHEGALVHLTGLATTGETLADPNFGIAANAIHLQRETEMYQWVESSETRTEKKLGGGEREITTYTYTREWSSDHHATADFKEPAGHENPAEIPWDSRTWSADDVTLGAFQLPASLADSIESWKPIAPAADAPMPAGSRLVGETVYLRADGREADPASPEVGDLRVTFQAAYPAQVSVVAQQASNGLTGWMGPSGSTIERLMMGLHTSEQMIAQLEAENRMLTWILRGVGFAMMAIGMGLLFAPLAVAGDIVPLFGDVIRLGTGIASAVVALGLSFVTIALGWVAYRPLVGVPLLVLGVAALVALVVAARRRREDATPVPAPA